MSKFRLLPLVSLIMMVGCASVAKVDEKQAANINNAYKNGQVGTALQALDQSFNVQKLDPKKDKIDTTYYLEKGTFLTNLGPAKLQDSTSSFMGADRVLADWENQAALSLKMTSAEFSNALKDMVKFNALYLPRDYEKSILNLQLAQNHTIAKRYDLALPGARRIQEREEIIRDLRAKEYEDSSKKLREQTQNAGKQGISGGINSVQQIPGYDVSVFNDPEVTKLKNSYQNAAAYYLAGFIFEQQNETSLAQTSFQRANELAPNASFIKASLNNLDKKKNTANNSEVLVVVDSGFLSDVYSFKATIPFVTPSGPKAVTWVVPSLAKNQIMYNPRNVTLNNKSYPIERVANVEAMSRRELKDQMPTYIAKAMASSIVQIVAQEVASRAIDRSGGGDAVKLLGKLVTSVAINALAAGDVDTRMWKSLPSEIYMARVSLPKGEQILSIPTVAGVKTAKINVTDPYEVVRVRIFANGEISVSNSNRKLSDDEYSVFKPQAWN